MPDPWKYRTHIPWTKDLGRRATPQDSTGTTQVPKILEDDPWSQNFRQWPYVHPHEHPSPPFQQRSGGQASSIKDPMLYRGKVRNSKPLNSTLFSKNRHLTLTLESSKPAPHRYSLSLTLSLFLQVPIVTSGDTVTIWWKLGSSLIINNIFTLQTSHSHEYIIGQIT